MIPLSSPKRRKNNSGKSLVFATILVLLAATLLVRGRQCVAAGLSNMGYVSWVRGSVGTEVLNDESHLADASVWWRRAQSIDPHNRSVDRGFGWVLAAKGQFSRAAQSWSSGGLTTQHLIAMGSYAEYKGEYEDTLRWYKLASEQSPLLSIPWFRSGILLEELREWDRAVFSFQKASSLNTGEVSQSMIHYHIGYLYQRRFSPPDLGKAWDEYEAALATADELSIGERIQLYYWRGVLLRYQGQPERAVQEFERVLDLRPDHYATLVHMGRLYREEIQDSSLSEHFLFEAIRVNPDGYYAYFELGLLYKSLGNAQEAQKMFERVLDLRPDQYATLVEMGRLYRIKDSSLSEHFLFEAIRVNPDGYYAYFELGLLYASLGQVQEARNMLERALTLNPDSTSVQKALEKIHADVLVSNREEDLSTGRE